MKTRFGMNTNLWKRYTTILRHWSKTMILFQLKILARPGRIEIWKLQKFAKGVVASKKQSGLMEECMPGIWDFFCISNFTLCSKIPKFNFNLKCREWISPATVTWLLKELVENDDSHSYLTERLDWYILPVHNPDGYEYSRESKDNRLWRKTRSNNGSECPVSISQSLS